MDYCILSSDNTIENIIVCDSHEIAAQFGAVASYDGACIGDTYAPPPGGGWTWAYKPFAGGAGGIYVRGHY